MVSSPLFLNRPHLPALGRLPQLPQASLRALTFSDFPAWVRLRDAVLAELAHPDAYVREKDEARFFVRNSPPHGEGVGVFVAHEMIAYAMVSLPAVGDPDHLGAMIGLPSAGHFRVAQMTSCMVRQPWRAHQLQGQLLKLRCALAHAYQRPLCLAMVSLHNPQSLHNLLSQGMWIVWTGMIDGLRRHVLQRDLRSRRCWDPTDHWLIAADDFEQLCAAAASGYVGVEEVFDGVRRMLRYARLLPAGQEAGPAGMPARTVSHHGAVPR